MKQLFTALLLLFFAIGATAQHTATKGTTTATTVATAITYTDTQAGQTTNCEKSAAKLIAPSGAHEAVYRDKKTDDVFWVKQVPGKGWMRVILEPGIVAKAD